MIGACLEDKSDRISNACIDVIGRKCDHATSPADDDLVVGTANERNGSERDGKSDEEHAENHGDKSELRVKGRVGFGG